MKARVLRVAVSALHQGVLGQRRADVHGIRRPGHQPREREAQWGRRRCKGLLWRHPEASARCKRVTRTLLAVPLSSLLTRHLVGISICCSQGGRGQGDCGWGGALVCRRAAGGASSGDRVHLQAGGDDGLRDGSPQGGRCGPSSQLPRLSDDCSCWVWARPWSAFDACGQAVLSLPDASAAFPSACRDTRCFQFRLRGCCNVAPRTRGFQKLPAVLPASGSDSRGTAVTQITQSTSATGSARCSFCSAVALPPWHRDERHPRIFLFPPREAPSAPAAGPTPARPGGLRERRLRCLRLVLLRGGCWGAGTAERVSIPLLVA